MTFFTFTEDNQQQSRTLPLGLGADGMKGTADDGLPPEGDFTEQFEYDERGRQQRHTSFEGIITESIYDDDPSVSDSIPHFGRLYQKRFYADQAAFDAGTVSETITMTHDAFGRELMTVWDRMATTPGLVVDTWANTWDEHGRLIQVDSPTGQIFYEYDTQGRQVRVATRPSGFTPQNDDDVSTDIRSTYDLLGRLASVKTWERNDVLVDVDAVTAGQQPETNSYVYDVVGNLDREIKPDGSATDYTFDDLNRLPDIITTRSDGTLLTDFDYTLRPDGKRDFAVEKIYNDYGSLASHTTFDWEYDAAGRLTDEIFTNVDGLNLLGEALLLFRQRGS